MQGELVYPRKNSVWILIEVGRIIKDRFRIVCLFLTILDYYANIKNSADEIVKILLFNFSLESFQRKRSGQL